MAVLTADEIKTVVLESIVANPASDAPIGDTVLLRAINEAYAQVWEIGGPSVKNLSSTDAWTTANTAAGVAYGIRTDINEVLHAYASTQADVSASSVKNGTTTITSTNLFGSVVVGMEVSGTGITAGTYVVTKTDDSTLVLSQEATTGTHTLVFSSLGNATGDNELDRVELSTIEWLRKSNLTGTYTRPQCYAVSRMSTTTITDMNKLKLDYWPRVTGFYFPIKYLPQFAPLSGVTSSSQPDVNDLESYDIAWIAAADLAPRIGRSDLVPGILMKVSSGTQKALERKLSAMMSGDQDRESR